MTQKKAGKKEEPFPEEEGSQTDQNGPGSQLCLPVFAAVAIVGEPAASVSEDFMKVFIRIVRTDLGDAV